MPASSLGLIFSLCWPLASPSVVSILTLAYTTRSSPSKMCTYAYLHGHRHRTCAHFLCPLGEFLGKVLLFVLPGGEALSERGPARGLLAAGQSAWFLFAKAWGR